MPEINLIRDLVLILLTALGGGFLAKIFKIPLLVGYILGGIFVGAILGFWLKLGPEITTLAEIGVALLLFTLGIEFSFRRLTRVSRVAVWGGILQILLTIILGVLIFPRFGFDFYASLFLGAVTSLSSTAIVVRILSERGEIDSLAGEIMVGWLLVQDLAVLPMIIILPQIAHLNGDSWPALFGAIFKAVIILSLVVFLGKKLVPQILAKVAEVGSREFLLLAVVAFCLLAALGTASLGLSFALGAFFAGLLVSESSQNHAVFAEIRPLRDLFSLVFFVSLGFLLTPAFLFTFWGKILAITIMVGLLKFFLVFLLVLWLGYHLKTALWVGAGIFQVGEFAFVLVAMGKNLTIISAELYFLILAVTILSMLFTPFIFNLSPFFYLRLKNFSTKFAPLRRFSQFDHWRDVKEKLLLEDHVVICGHGRVGKHVRRALQMSQIPYVVVDFNQAVVKDLTEHGANVVYGDPTDFEVLDFAQVDKARVLVVALPDRASQEMIIQNAQHLNPKIAIICRSHFEEDKERLQAAGAQKVIQPEFEAGLSIISEILVLFKREPQEISSALRQIKKEHGI